MCSTPGIVSVPTGKSGNGSEPGARSVSRPRTRRASACACAVNTGAVNAGVADRRPEVAARASPLSRPGATRPTATAYAEWAMNRRLLNELPLFMARISGSEGDRVPERGMDRYGFSSASPNDLWPTGEQVRPIGPRLPERPALADVTSIVATIEIHLRDLSGPLVAAWQKAFADVPGVSISQGDIFSAQPGPLQNNAPIDILADAIVSPANSFGFMDGGIDAVYTHQFGFGLEQRLQALLAAEHGGELPVGGAVIVETGSEVIPWCVSAPTMRVPEPVPDTVNAYLAFRAALRAVLAHNAAGQRPIQRVLCPGLATTTGRMPHDRCAAQMRVAWDNVLGEGAPRRMTWRVVADLHRRLLA
jgi:O-acetyl-ADP-ribose deacetylase (regulator of RNase III)